MKELNMPTNFAVINISSGTRYINSRIHGIINKPFSEVRACVAKEYEKGVLKGIAFGKSIKLEGVSEGKIVDIHSFTNSIYKIIYHVSLEGYEQNYVNKCIEEALCQANFEKSNITCSDHHVSVQV